MSPWRSSCSRSSWRPSTASPPTADLSFRSVASGTALATLSWALASLAFSLYLSVSPGFGATHGSLGAAISLLLYLYLSAIVLLLGAEVNARIHRRSPKRGKVADPANPATGSVPPP